MIDLTPIINAAIFCVASIVSGFVIKYIKSKCTEKEFQEMLKWIDIAVSAAQQMYHQLDGQSRKEYVVNFLRDKGYDIDDVAVDGAIEAAVLKLHKELEGKT